ncbi:ABC transporter ATP-binding protein [Hamadaea tsunoensis]|uniref:ABC transporter ATP-binding protein n=1 Tax=Hamadaea tsunoensis TaxID=53368 RepID=UPI001FE067F4|nr:ABC transporter ATP-binding protein [Hamadaea tsunoensis]
MRSAGTRRSPLRLELRGITKRFGDLVANDQISLTVEPGEIHALLGENGAGKSTLMNVLYGLLQPDEGEILVDGRPIKIKGPGDAIAAGIGMVHQHFMLVPVFTVTDNVMLGAEQIRGPGGFLDHAKARKLVVDVSHQYGLPVDPDAVVEDLPIGVQQRVEIVKALTRDVDLLILDEPTAVLTPQETDELLDVMRGLKAAGKSIVFITHKLREVKAVADRITVIRRGRTVGTAAPDAPESELADLMVGRSVLLRVEKDEAVPGRPVLSIADLVVADDRGLQAVGGISLEVRAGEVLGVAGVQGNGQTELVEAVMGLRPIAAGSIKLLDDDVTAWGTRKILDAGVGYIPEDRGVDGLVREFSVAENLVLDTYAKSPNGTRFALNRSKIESGAAEKISEYDIRTRSPLHAVGTLSGGNQQKVIVARELSRKLQLLVAAQPTRGVDVGSIEFIHKRIVAERDTGSGVLLVSSELDEVLSLADRVAVMYRGRVLAIVSPDTPRDEIGLLMAGITGKQPLPADTPGEVREAAGDTETPDAEADGEETAS